MNIVIIYLRLYGTCAKRAVVDVRRSAWTLLLPVVLALSLIFLSQVLALMGMIGGFLVGFALAAIFSCYLYFVGELVSGARVSVDELKKSVGAYFWNVLNLLFVLWMAELVVGMLIARSAQAATFTLIIYLAEFVLLNVAPEVIYQHTSYSGLATAQRCIAFIHANWIEWFIPNIALAAAFYYGVPRLLMLGVPSIVVAVLAGACAHVIFIFRGHLFRELDQSSHRQRMFRWRSAAS